MMAMMDDIAPQIATWLDRAMYNRHAVAPRDYTRQPPPALAPSVSETEPLPELPADNAPARRTRGGKPAPIDLD